MPVRSGEWPLLQAPWSLPVGWVQLLHMGALRDINTRFMRAMGPDSGFDTIGDSALARPRPDRCSIEGCPRRGRQVKHDETDF